jgi:hypothetical protein
MTEMQQLGLTQIIYEYELPRPSLPSCILLHIHSVASAPPHSHWQHPTFPPTMPPTRNRQIENVFTLGSPPPTLACPHCPRHFRSKGGRKKHIQKKHGTDGLEPQESRSSPSLSPLPSPQAVPSSPHSHELYERPPSTTMSDPTKPPSSPSPPSRGGSDHFDVDMDIEHPDFDQDETPPQEPLGSFGFGQELSRNSSPVTRTYHPKLNGKSSFFRMLYIC